MLRCLFWIFVFVLAPCAQATETDANRSLREALTCGGDPLATVQSLAANASAAFDEGYAGYDIGEEIDTKSIVLLRDPIIIAEAQTYAVVGGPAQLRDDFNALVQARFSGDWRPVAAMLQLQPEADGGTLVRALDIDSSGGATDVCPMTIQLKALEDGGFLLGCGWCNG